MRHVNVDCGRFTVTERDDYSLCFTRKQYGNEFEEMALWGVLLTSAFRSERFYVLASSEDNAIGQARCAAKLSTYHVTPEQEAQISAHAERLPLIVQGWSGNLF